MRKIGLLFISLLLSYFSFNQSIEEIQTKIDSLKIEKLELERQLNHLSNEISELQQFKLTKIKENEFKTGVAIFTKQKTNLYEERGTWTKTIATIPPLMTLLAYDFKNNYYFVEYDTLNGYVFCLDIETIEQKNKRIEKEQIKKQNQIQKELATQNELRERKNSLVRKYGEVNGEKIFNGKIWLGMTKEMVIDSWGQPRDINKSVGSWGVHEQWVYYNSYLYFRNGKLTSWQN